jgi:hypothetical protein
MSTITIDNNIHSDLEKASKFTGMNERELTERALILYLDSLRNISDLKAELDAWQELGLQSLHSVEDTLNTHP